MAQAGEWAEQHAGDLNHLERAFLTPVWRCAVGRRKNGKHSRQRELVAAQRLAQEQQQRADEQALSAATSAPARGSSPRLSVSPPSSSPFLRLVWHPERRNADLAETRQAEAQNNANLAATRAIEALDSANLADAN